MPLSAFSAVKTSVRLPALLRNPRGEEVCATTSQDLKNEKDVLIYWIFLPSDCT
jgi:formylmethanofuran dehydrogenase subunit B